MAQQREQRSEHEDDADVMYPVLRVPSQMSAGMQKVLSSRPHGELAWSIL